jgi:hypothetical protein
VLGKKTGGRQLGSRNKKTLARLAEAAADAAGTADGPRAVPSLSRILRWWLERADREIAKGDAADPAVIERAYAEARTTAGILAAYQSPRLSAVALGQVSKMVVVVKGGLPPRDTRALPAAESGGVAGPEPDNAGGGRGRA